MPKGRPTGNGYRIMNERNTSPPAFKDHRSDTVSSLGVLGAAFCCHEIQKNTRRAGA